MMKYRTTTQPLKRNACALLALFLLVIPSLALAQVLTVSPQPTEGFVFLSTITFQTAACGVERGTPSSGCTINPAAGTLVTVEATANLPYQFVGWSGACSGTSTRTTVTVNTNITCTPHFIHVPYAQVATFSRHQCAVTTTGAVQCWGEGSDGQLGNGQSNDSLIPVTVQGISTAMAVVVGSYHSCALLMDKTMQCWGDNFFRALGTANTNGSNTPVDVINITDVIAMFIGDVHTCAVRENGSVLCWGGYNQSNNVLGLGNITQSSTPTALSNITNATAISGGIHNTCAVLRTGSAKCWGNNHFGQLGTGNTDNSNTPVDVINLTNAMTIGASNDHVCAVLNNGRAKCWGSNDSGQLGTGNTDNSSTPVDVINLSNAIAIAASSANTCALLNNGRVQCWGNNRLGQLGNGMTNHSSEPVAVIGITTVIAIDATNSASTICAILTDGNAHCWGAGYGSVPTLAPGQSGVPTPSAIISVYSHSPFIAVSPYRTIPDTIVTNTPSWLTYSAPTGAFFGIPTSAASGITITPGSNPSFPVSPVIFSISTKDLPILNGFTIKDTDARDDNVPIDAVVNTLLINPRFIAQDQSDSEVQVPLRWSLTQAAGKFRINDNTGTLALTSALTLRGRFKHVDTGLPTRFDNVPHTITVRIDFPTAPEALFQPSLPAATSSKSFVITAIAVLPSLRLHLKTFLEGPLQ